jgi:outer membrane protein assembly factor BamE (lipoprotein component of BamABCDE complex)
VVEKFTYRVGETKTLFGFNKDWRTGRWITAEQLAKIHRGATSREELIQILGPATVAGLNIFGTEVLLWRYSEGRERIATKEQDLSVWFNPDSTVQNFSLANYRP